MLREHYGDRIRPYNVLTENYEYAVSHLTYGLDPLPIDLLSKWNFVMSRSLKLCNIFIREAQDPDRPTHDIIRSKTGSYAR